MDKKNKKKFDWKILLLSFGITCVILAVVIGLMIWWYSITMANSQIDWEWNTPLVWIGNGVAFLIMFGIIHHFLKKPKDDRQEKWNP